MPGYMAEVVVDWGEFKKGKVVLQKISSSPPPVDVEQLVKEALEGSESADKLAGEALKDEEAETEK